MDTVNHLRSYTVGKLLSSSPPPSQISSNNSSTTTTATLKINKANVQSLVEQFLKFNHNEKLLFLVNIQHGTVPIVDSTPHHLSMSSTNSSTTCTTTTTTTTTDSPPPNNIKTEDNSSSSSSTTPPPLLITSLPTARLSQTCDWLLENFTADSQTALPKEEVYDFYVKSISTKPISTADFGKLMRQVFPEVKARRLGQRGASKYCYANIRKRSEYDLEKPRLLPVKYTIEADYLAWAKSNFGLEFTSLPQLLAYLKCNNFKNVLLRKRRNSSFSNKRPNKEDNEIKKYFDNNKSSHQNNDEFPQLRTLLSSSSSSANTILSSSNSEFTPISKKRHFSNNVDLLSRPTGPSGLETLLGKDNSNGGGGTNGGGTNGASGNNSGGGHNSSGFSDVFRSASVPIFDRFLSSSADSGYDSVHSNTPVVLDNYNPLLSSVSLNNDVFDSVFDLIANEQAENNNGGSDSTNTTDYFEY